MDLKEGVQAAAQASLIRRYPQFEQGDNPKWEKVAEQARKGVKSPLAALPYDGDAEKQPVCAAILSQIGGGKRGGDVRKHFMAPPYGWPQDTVDGALLALIAGGCVRASLNGAPVDAAALTGPTINDADFKAETVVITVMQRIAVRKLLQDNGVAFKQNEEGAAIPGLLSRLLETARAAGGPAPLPIPPDTAYLDEIAQSAGNAQIRPSTMHASGLHSTCKAGRRPPPRRRRACLAGRRSRSSLSPERACRASRRCARRPTRSLADRRLLADPGPGAAAVCGRGGWVAARADGGTRCLCSALHAAVGRTHRDRRSGPR